MVERYRQSMVIAVCMQVLRLHNKVEWNIKYTIPLFFLSFDVAFIVEIYLSAMN